MVQWLNSVLANLSLPTEASEEELRACLIDGTVLFRILSKLKPGSVNEVAQPFDFYFSFPTCIIKWRVFCVNFQIFGSREKTLWSRVQKRSKGF